jgi:hypothetical protein
MVFQIVVQGRATRFFEQILEHQILAATLGKVLSIFLPQGPAPPRSAKVLKVCLATVMRNAG